MGYITVRQPWAWEIRVSYNGQWIHRPFAPKEDVIFIILSSKCACCLLQRKALPLSARLFTNTLHRQSSQRQPVPSLTSHPEMGPTHGKSSSTNVFAILQSKTLPCFLYALRIHPNSKSTWETMFFSLVREGPNLFPISRLSYLWTYGIKERKESRMILQFRFSWDT